MSDDKELLLPSDLWRPKSQCYTKKNKLPRTVNNIVYRDWSKSEVHKPRNFYSHPREPYEPGPPWSRFRPLPPIENRDEDRPRRIKLINNRQGVKTPEDFLHFGYKHFCHDPLNKKLRHYNDPIPYPLATEFREAYQSPKVKSNLLLPNPNYKRYGMTPRVFAFGA
ncbi:hypothetical protein BaRGS_00032829, partial [Batillaria attramentaria]